ncbi:MAG TPA: aminoacyl-tRNA hydrolase [Campylobacterales bacterium]|nr:aminoacyl-tRNA hydrolase [Campylobacterales bacterium]
MNLIVGLGNPTSKYKKNRHNIGFMVIDSLVDSLKANDISKKEFKGKLFKSPKTMLLKPDTFMNLSGESVLAVCSYYKIDIENIVVVHDELDIEFGRIKLKYAGSSGGHNGLKSIDKLVGNEYLRVRSGIGRPTAGKDISNYVLSDFSKDETLCLEKIINLSAEISLELLQNELKDVQNSFSSKKSICE